MATMSGHRERGKTSNPDVNSFRKSLLGWYDRHRRVLPWRALPGMKADPYHVWLSEIMLQQTVVAAVRPYFLKFLEKWPTVHDLAAAPQEDVMQAWAGLGYYARARNLHKCAKEVSGAWKGRFPDNEEELKSLPGIGDYTAAAIAAIAFDRPATVVDGNVERVVARYFQVEEPLPGSKKKLRELAGRLAEGRADRPGDFAQAMMDLGATICTPKSPRCALCPLHDGCAGKKAGIAAELPRRGLKKKKPQKFGYVYWIMDKKGRVLLERRGEDMMLGGMVGLPTSDWHEKGTGLPANRAPAGKPVRKARKDLRIFHSFTHFDLELEGKVLQADKSDIPAGGVYFWSGWENIDSIGLPSLFKKFVKIMLNNKDSER